MGRSCSAVCGGGQLLFFAATLLGGGLGAVANSVNRQPRDRRGAAPATVDAAVFSKQVALGVDEELLAAAVKAGGSESEQSKELAAKVAPSLLNEV